VGGGACGRRGLWEVEPVGGGACGRCGLWEQGSVEVEPVGGGAGWRSWVLGVEPRVWISTFLPFLHTFLLSTNWPGIGRVARPAQVHPLGISPVHLLPLQQPASPEADQLRLPGFPASSLQTTSQNKPLVFIVALCPCSVTDPEDGLRYLQALPFVWTDVLAGFGFLVFPSEALGDVT
jgi:hypothetical protein